MPGNYHPNQQRNHPNPHRGGGHRQHGGQRGGHGGGGDGTTKLTSPYNFVPVADDVFFPDWGVPSHDCPFSDAVSGELHVKLTAKSPIYVRGTHPKPDKPDQLLWNQDNPSPQTPFGKWAEFYSDPASNKYAIPGTTWKGVIRNVLKIAGFGSIGYADDDFISVRDLNDPKYTSQITKKRSDGSYEAKVRGGWLSENPDPTPGAPEWVIIPCKVARVEQSSLGNGINRGDAKQKYNTWDHSHTNNRSVMFDLPTTAFGDGNDIHRNHSCGPLFYTKATNLGGGRETGTIVLTGQAGRKHMEFIFYDEETTSLPVAPGVQKKFKDTHPHDNEGWKYWRQTLEQRGGRVPVFWIENDKAPAGKPEERIVAFGLAQMFRFPARNLHDAIPPRHKTGTNLKAGLDLADRLFGTVREDDALRGRVAFGQLTLTQKNEQMRFGKIIKTVLGAPRPTFYPAYLEQPKYSVPNGKLAAGTDANGKVIPPEKMYQTWLSPEVRIRGWKRYWVTDAPDGQADSLRHEHPIPTNQQGQPLYKVATAFRPLKAGSQFEGVLRFHNLTRRELGALIWALTWGGETALRHSVGMGKSLGMGSCTIEIDWSKSRLAWRGDPNLENQQRQKYADEVKAAETGNGDAAKRKAFAKSCQDDFAAEMDSFTKGKLTPENQRAAWIDTQAMKELRAMANPANATKLEAHKPYPKLDDFKEIKKAALVLPRITEIVGNPPAAVAQRQLASGNPPLPSSTSPEDESSPAKAPARIVNLPPPPVFKVGQQVTGVLIPEPGKPDGDRIYFQPDGHPELAGNTGKKRENDLGAVIGQRWNATVSTPKPYTYKLISSMDHA